MAGMGPAPKPKGRRARRNADTVPTTILRFQEAEQPPLPENQAWPEETLEWWKMWAESPQAEHFGITDWEFLKDTALLHAMLWGNGDTSVLAELRIRVAKFGATPEDRARLRMQFAEADERDGRRKSTAPSSREKLASVKVVDFKQESS